MKPLWLALALAAAVCGGAVSSAVVSSAAAQPAPDRAGLTEHEVRQRLAEHGYTQVNDVDFDDGVWQADARSADGNRVQVRLDPRNGRIYANEQVAGLSERDVRARLSAAGYTDIHDVKYRDGVWNAEADDPGGRDVALKLDPDSGRIIGVADD